MRRVVVEHQADGGRGSFEEFQQRRSVVQPFDAQLFGGPHAELFEGQGHARQVEPDLPLPCGLLLQAGVDQAGLAIAGGRAQQAQALRAFQQLRQQLRARQQVGRLAGAARQGKRGGPGPFQIHGWSGLRHLVLRGGGPSLRR
ncbi:hypothetical protein D3C76_934860 [compost metagenome]